ncbi:polysaccharide pyruvyl transferase family protein [Mucilaginibacter sp. PAMB04168]|uniref:polysaccharide pyruvyl transferase family protein n=1 Tax=Mucilaginibacter sp. PAMB04168 TaxID=3138567 RepID=UPI0031F685A5
MSVNRRQFIETSGKALAGTFLLPHAALSAIKEPNNGMQTDALESVKAMAPKRILLRSAWAVSNIGDIGHTPGTLHVLEEYLPDAEITLWPVIINAEVESMLLRRFPKLKIIKGTLTSGEGAPLNSDILQAFEQTDFFLYNSGMHFNYGLFNYEWNGLMGLMSQFFICQKLGKPYGMFGHSFDLWAQPSPYVFASVLNKAAFIYCRDGESLKYIKENGIKAPVMEFGPDGCFGIDTLDEPKGLAYLKANGLQDNDFMALIIRSYTPKPEATANNKDKLNPYQPTPEQQELDRERFAKINALVTAWVRQTKKKVLLAPEAFKEITAAKALVYDQQPDDVKPYLVHRHEFWNADEALSVYKRARVVMGMEPHSLIMALAVGVPVIHTCPFSFGKKGWMFRDIGLPEWLFDIDKDDTATMQQALFHIHNNYTAARNKAAKAMQFVRQRQKDAMQVLKLSIK